MPINDQNADRAKKLNQELQQIVEEYGITAVRRELRLIAPPKPRKRPDAPRVSEPLSRDMNALLNLGHKGAEPNKAKLEKEPNMTGQQTDVEELST